MSTVFNQGIDDHRKGITHTDNPYQVDDWKHLEWLEGWLAIKEHRERVKKYIRPGSWTIK